LKKKIFSRLILMLLLCTVLAGLFQLPPTALGSKVTFVSCREVDQSQKRWSPIDVTNSFATTDEKIYLFLEIEDVKGPITTTIKAIDPQGKLFYEAPLEWKEGSYDWIQSFVWLAVAKMTPGEWSAEAYANDELIATLKFTLIPPLPHLVLVSKTIEPKEGEAIFPGETATIKYTWKNDGGSTAKKVQMKVFGLPKGLTLLEQTDAKDLPVGSSEEWIIRIRADEPGNYSFTVQLLMENEKLTEGIITVLVSEKPFSEQYGLYVGVAIVIVIVLVAVLVLMRRRKRPAPPAQPVPTVPLGVAPQVPTQKFCVNCGTPLPADAQFCGKCGSRQ